MSRDVFGPFATYEEIGPAAIAGGRGFDALRVIDDIFLHDAYVIDVVQTPDDTIWLRSTINDGIPIGRDEGDGPMKAVIHYLRFDSAEAAHATIHSNMTPTRESYSRASAIVREEMNWIKRGTEADAWTLSFEDVRPDDIDDDELPYASLRPGDDVVFPPFDPAGDLPIDRHMHRWPVRTDRILSSAADGRPLEWIGRTPGTFMPIRLIRIIAERDGETIRHHLSHQDEKGVDATLRNGRTTAATYAAAGSVHVETLRRDGEGPLWTLTVTPMKAPFDIPPTGD